MVCIICNLFRVPCERERFNSELTDAAIAFEREVAEPAAAAAEPVADGEDEEVAPDGEPEVAAAAAAEAMAPIEPPPELDEGEDAAAFDKLCEFRLDVGLIQTPFTWQRS